MSAGSVTTQGPLDFREFRAGNNGPPTAAASGLHFVAGGGTQYAIDSGPQVGGANQGVDATAGRFVVSPLPPGTFGTHDGTVTIAFRPLGGDGCAWR